MDDRVACRPFGMDLMWTWCACTCLFWTHFEASSPWTLQLKVYSAWRIACYFFLLEHHQLHDQTCWETLSKVKWDNFTMSILSMHCPWLLTPFTRYFCKMLTIFSSPLFYSQFIHMPATDQIHTKTCMNPWFWPFFKGAVGAIDSSHINAAPPVRSQAAFQNCKGFISQNCFFACDFDMLFMYALTGWEGSAMDAQIYQDMCSRYLHVLNGRYFLGDAGFSLCPEILIPYQRICYHLAEWCQVQLRYVSTMNYYSKLKSTLVDQQIKRNSLIFDMLLCRM